MTSTTSTGAPQYLLVMDVTAIPPDEGGLHRLADRLGSIRSNTVVVVIDGAKDDRQHLPEADYAISRDGKRIMRLPTEELVPGWPPQRRKGVKIGPAAAVTHLAGELLITASEIYVIAGSGHPVLDGDFAHTIVVGGEAESGSVWLEDATDDALVRGLEEVHLLTRAGAAGRDIADEAFEKAIDSLRRCITPLGFTAASLKDNPLGSHDANYAAVWSRDGVIAGLWSLCLDDEEFTNCFIETMRVLIRHQAPSGQIAANVRIQGEIPDYSGIGGIASIDSVLWFVIGAVRLAFHAGSKELVHEFIDPVARAMTWLAAHDANNDALLEIPESSDWMDLFPRSYNVLYDEVLWWQACIDAGALFDAAGWDGSDWTSHADTIRERIIDLFWPTGDQLLELTGSSSGRFSIGQASYLLSQVTPFDYGWRCDVYANLLASLSGLLDEHKNERLFRFLWGVGVNSPYPVVCLYPPVLSGAEDWKDYFLVNFLNLPDHYHNGGIWPFIGGLWVRTLYAMGRTELAHRELATLAEACRQGIHGEWEFNEWLHGHTGRPMGKIHQAWSSASYMHAYLTLHEKADANVFPALDPSVFDD